MTLLLAAVQALAAPAEHAPDGWVHTVCGPVRASELGPTLVHEHILVDFVGADRVSPERYDADEVFETMLPYLRDLKAAGIGTLVECTPNYLGRDPVLLRRLSLASELHVVTNTGLYKDPYLPAWAHSATAEEIAAEWIREATEGIGAEAIRPGFVKIATNEGALTDIQRKIVTAAAITSVATGLPVVSHTTTAPTALEQLDIMQHVGMRASRLIVAHADADPDLTVHAEVVARGAWLSYDGIRRDNAEAKAELVREAIARWPDHLLISQDAGWYNVGEPGGGSIVPFDWLPRAFVPALLGLGVAEEQVRALLCSNPARALAVAERNS